MTIHVNIGEAKTRLSELVAAARRGEDVIVANAGQPQVRLVPVGAALEEEVARKAAKRRNAFGKWRHLATDPDNVLVPPSMTDAEYDERMRRKFEPSA